MKRLFPCIMIALLSACTTTQAKKNVLATPEAVVEAPVKALNIQKKNIPDFLKKTGNPYEGTSEMSCETLKDEVTRLTEFAGPDWDSEDHFTKRGRTTSEFVDAILPYGGIVRFISGASEHNKKVVAAISYAVVRRAHLKTLRTTKDCPVEADTKPLPDPS